MLLPHSCQAFASFGSLRENGCSLQLFQLPTRTNNLREAIRLFPTPPQVKYLGF